MLACVINHGCLYTCNKEDHDEDHGTGVSVVSMHDYEAWDLHAAMETVLFTV